MKYFEFYRRIHESGLKPLEGDLIFIDEDEAEPIDDLILIEADADEKGLHEKITYKDINNNFY